jgi:hypothetical protein
LEVFMPSAFTTARRRATGGLNLTAYDCPAILVDWKAALRLAGFAKL